MLFTIRFSVLNNLPANRFSNVEVKLFHALNRYISFIISFSFELNFSVGESKKSVVFSEANI